MTLTTDWPVHPAAELFPMLDADELQSLADDIRANGLRHDLVLYRDGDATLLLDGRNRLAACRIAGVEPTTTLYRGDDPLSVVVSENVRRRHLTEGQKGMLAVELLPLYEEQGRRRKAEAGRSAAPGKPEKDEADRPHLSTQQRAPQARDLAATAVGTSGKTVDRSKRVAEQAPDLAEKVKAGELAIDRADRILRDRKAEEQKVAAAKVAAAELEMAHRVDLRLGDFRTVLDDIEAGTVDAIITDPPYPHEYIPLMADLAKLADRLLTPDGVLVVLMGQTYLPEVYHLLGTGRPYRWTGALLTEGPGYVSHPRRIQSSWKPLLVYGGGPRFGDVVRSEGSDANAKQLHKWGQDYAAFHTIVERMTRPGQVVLDPFMGSGTTLLAAHALGRHVIGCEVDETHYATAVERVA